jgi:hypothetical protein
MLLFHRIFSRLSSNIVHPAQPRGAVMIELVIASMLSAPGATSDAGAGDTRPTEKKICKSAVQTATRIDAHRVCRTRSEWGLLEDSQAKAGKRGSGDEDHELEGIYGVMMTAPALKDQGLKNERGGPK